MNMYSTISISASPSPLSPTTPLNPHAKSWIPEAERTPFDDQHAPETKKLALMLPHEFYSTPSTSPPSPVLTLSPASVLNQPFQQLDLLSQPIATSPYLFNNPSVHYYEVFNFNEADLCNNSGRLQPQPYLHAVLPLFASTVPHISRSCTNDYEVESDDVKTGIGENGTEKKRDSRICCWGTDWRFVPPRFERSQNMLYQGRKKTLRQEWKPKKTQSDDGIISTEAALVSSSSHPTKSSMVDFQHCKKTTVMIRNIPNQYRYILSKTAAIMIHLENRVFL